MKGFSLEASMLSGLGSHDNLLQSPYWAALKQRFGNSASAFTLSSDTYPIISAVSGKRLDHLPLLLLFRDVPGPIGAAIGYVPHGPDIELTPDIRQPFLEWLAAELRERIPSGCLFLRFDLPFGVETPEDREDALAAPFRRAVVDIQVPDTVVIDLTLPEDEILSRMKSKTRYNVRLSGRKGVMVRMAGVEELDLWYDMAKETAVRDRITLHSRDYFEALFQEAEAREDTGMKLLIAEESGVALAAIIISIFGRRCIYNFGASRTAGRNLMPTFALQWKAIQYAKAAGCTSYDLLGIPPTDDPEHPLAGLYRVKTGYGGEIVHRAGCWDYPIKPAAYRLFRTAEAVRNTYFKTIRKKTLGLLQKAGRG